MINPNLAQIGLGSYQLTLGHAGYLTTRSSFPILQIFPYVVKIGLAWGPLDTGLSKEAMEPKPGFTSWASGGMDPLDMNG